MESWTGGLLIKPVEVRAAWWRKAGRGGRATAVDLAVADGLATASSVQLLCGT
jgi:hypothetical protein